MVGLAVLNGSQAQTADASAEITEFSATPGILPASSGLLTVSLQAETDLESFKVRLAIVDPDGRVQRTTEAIRLVPQTDGIVHAEKDLQLDLGGNAGPWTVRISRAFVVEDGREESVSLDGIQQTTFRAYGIEPVAGTSKTPWPQPGGDPMHTGRTLASGPDGVEVVRWELAPGDGQPFHTPVVGPDGAIYAVTWGGILYALDDRGVQQWDQPVELRNQAPFPPAVGADGSVLVVQGDGTLTAIGQDGNLDWRYTTPGDEAFVSGPVVGPQGRVHVIQEPWTLVVLSRGGQLVESVELSPPSDPAPEPPRVPEPTVGPRLAVTPDQTTLAVAGDGLAVVSANGSVDQRIDCNCTAGAVSYAPDADTALVAANREVVALSIRTGSVEWSTEDQTNTELRSTLWHPPTIGWDDRVYIPTESGRFFTIGIDGNNPQMRNFFQPIRGQPVIDATGQLYFADACTAIRSVTDSLSPIWTRELGTDSCNGLTASVVVTPSGGILWPGPDGWLRMLGSNQPPEASFETYWEDGDFVLDASSSTDPDGTPLSFAWEIGNLTQAQGRIVRPDLPGPGNYTIELTVSDRLSSVTTTRTVTVNFPPEPRIIDRSEGLSILLNASTSIDPDGDELYYNWSVDGEHAQSGPVLSLNASGPRVFSVTLVVDDGEHLTTKRQTVLAPARETWSYVTLTLHDGDCPSGVCAAPSSLSLVNGSLTEILVVNGAGRSVSVESGLPVVTGGSSTLTLAPGEQDNLYLQPRPGPDPAISIGLRDGQLPETIVPAEIRPAPADLTWQLVPPEEPLTAGQSNELRVHLEGTAPPADVQLQVNVEQLDSTVASTRVALPAGEPVNHTVGVDWIPAAAGTQEISVSVVPTDSHLAEVHPAEGETGTHEVVVEEAGLLTSAVSYVEEHGLVLGLGALVVAGVAGGASYVVMRRKEETVASGTASAADSSTPVPDGDATVAQSFMPRKVERFHVGRVLGEGGFGRTYLAQDTVLERDVVLKELEHVGVGEARELLLHEAKTAANLSHANVVVVHDVIEEEGRLLLVMEYVPGGTLDDRLGEPIDLKASFELISDVLEGLEALHEAGIVHRDLKPSNILITPEDVAKITDFGVAAHIEDGGPDEGDDTFVGTPRWMAPEQLAGDPPIPETDVYAAGAILYRMLTGEHPLGLGDSTPSVDELLELEPRLPIEGVPDHVNEALEKALARDPSDRFESAGAFLHALEQWTGDTTRASSGGSSTS